MALHKSRNNFWKSHERLKEDKNKTLNSISYFTVVKGIYIKVEITFEYHLRLKADKNKTLNSTESLETLALHKYRMNWIFIKSREQ